MGVVAAQVRERVEVVQAGEILGVPVALHMGLPPGFGWIIEGTVVMGDCGGLEANLAAFVALLRRHASVHDQACIQKDSGTP